MSKNENNRPQRALVLQGGGSLGAYEAGVFNVLYNWIKNQNDANKEEDNIFDVIAGTSIGAINAAFLVSYVIKEKRRGEKKSIRESWEGCAEKLEEFWKSQLASNVNLSKWWPFSWDEKSWTNSWDILSGNNSNIATGEAARRYYSAKEFIINGAPNVFSPRLPPKIDSKFFDNFIVPNIWYRYDNSRLKETINGSIRFPIATSYQNDKNQKDNKEPRLLAISVDVEEGETVTFDSYEKSDGIRKSEYGDYTSGDNNGKKKGTYEHTIRYDKGIMAEHILASASVPEHYDYTLVPKEYDYTMTEEEKSIDIQNNDRNKYSRFWDGGLLSNTPLRELIQSHKDYWFSVIGNENDDALVPDLEVYIVDVWPSVDVSYPVPSDLDGIRDRKNDFTYQDKTPYDEKVANIVSDYIDLVEEFINLAERHKIQKSEIGHILSKHTKRSTHRNGKRRTYGNLIGEKFDTKVIRIERSIDRDDVANKWCDFSLGTISNLFEQGMLDALKTLAKEIMRSKSIQLTEENVKEKIMISESIHDASSQLDLFIMKQGTNYDLIQSTESVKRMLPDLMSAILSGTT